MKHDESKLAADPDLFSRELHRLLLTDGSRSRGVRRLMKVARRNPGAELERILETKINEFKRHQREVRVPTAWNAPQRGLEWLMDYFALTPPKDVLMTLVYVVIALLSVEMIKGVFSSSEPKVVFPERTVRIPDDAWAYRPAINLEEDDRPDATSETDTWLTNELIRAIKSEEFSEVLEAQLRQIREEQAAAELPAMPQRRESQETAAIVPASVTIKSN